MKMKFIALIALGCAAVATLPAMGEKGCTPETCKPCQATDEKAFSDKLNPAMKDAFMKMTAEQKMECMKSKELDANKAVEMMMKVEKK